MKISILSITASRSDLKKPIKIEVLRTEEVSEECYFSTLLEIAVEEITAQQNNKPIDIRR